MPIAEGVASEVYSLVVAGDLVKSINDPQLMHELLLSFCRGSKSLDNDLSTMDIFLRENEEDNGDMIEKLSRGALIRANELTFQAGAERMMTIYNNLCDSEAE